MDFEKLYSDWGCTCCAHEPHIFLLTNLWDVTWEMTIGRLQITSTFITHLWLDIVIFQSISDKFVFPFPMCSLTCLVWNCNIHLLKKRHTYENIGFFFNLELISRSSYKGLGWIVSLAWPLQIILGVQVEKGSYLGLD